MQGSQLPSEQVDLDGWIALRGHICRGNYKGRYLAQGGYHALAERIFGGIDATHFLLEYDTPRAAASRRCMLCQKIKALCSA